MSSRRAQRTADAILDAAAAILERAETPGSAGALTIDGLAAEAGVAIATIYAHFQNKGGVLTALAERLLEVNARYVDEAAAKAKTPLDAVVAIGDAYLKFHRDHPIAFRLVAARDLGPGVAARQDAMLDGIAELLRQAQEAGQARPEVDARSTATFIWAAWNGVLALDAQGRLNDRKLRETVRAGRATLLAALMRPT